MVPRANLVRRPLRCIPLRCIPQTVRTPLTTRATTLALNVFDPALVVVPDFVRVRVHVASLDVHIRKY